MPASSEYSILIAEDDVDDRQMTTDAFALMKVRSSLAFVDDGEDLLDYLTHGSIMRESLPSLILLDLNMPKMTGGEAIVVLKADARWKHIPVVVLTTSCSERDVLASYRLGASSFVTKPRTFEGLVAVVESLQKYWLGIVTLPNPALR